MKKVKAVVQSKDKNGNMIVKYDSNPIINTMVYYVGFSDGSIRVYRENLIARNMYSHFDSNGFWHPILSLILDFSKDITAIQKCDQYIITKSCQCCMQKSTFGWNLLIAWKDGSEQWIPLSVMK